MSDLSALIERLEKLTGPDRDVDEAIQAWSVGATIEWQEYAGRNAYHRDDSWVSIGALQPLTASLDAAIALVERILPGHGRIGCKGQQLATDPMYAYQILPNDFASHQEPIGEAEHDCEAICLLIAALRAKVLVSDSDHVAG